MLKLSFFYCVLFILYNAMVCLGQKHKIPTTDSSLFACWHAVSHEYLPVYALSDEEIKSLSRKNICFTRDKIEMYNGSGFFPKYSLVKVRTDDFADENFQCPKEKLGILSDSVYEINITSMTKHRKNGPYHKMVDVIAYDGNFIYVFYEGIIFKLSNIQLKPSVRVSN